MKISSLPLRDQIAIEVLPGIVTRPGTCGPKMATKRAYAVADTLLAQMDLQNYRIAEAERRAEKAEVQNSILLNMNEDGNFGYRVALLEIWEFLGTKHQTETLQMLRDAFPEFVK